MQSTKVQTGSRENNFTMIRVIATLLVFFNHTGTVIGEEVPKFGGNTIGIPGLQTLFLVSGYLIMMSWISDPQPLRYAVRRFFRLWPPYAVMILVMTFIAGPLVSDLNVHDYFQWQEWRDYLLNLRFYIYYRLPGVFLDLPCATTVNATLWTMPAEAFLYILTPLIALVLQRKKGGKASFISAVILTAAVYGFDLYLYLYHSGDAVVFYGVEWIQAYHLMTYYMIGVLFTYEEVRKYLNLQVAAPLMFTLVAFQEAPAAVQYTAWHVILSYFVFSFVFVSHPSFSNFGKKLEVSYDIYLYGFFFQQLAYSLQLDWGVNFGYFGNFVFALVLTLPVAVLSYYLVDQPALKLGRYLVRKLKSPGKLKTAG